MKAKTEALKKKLEKSTNNTCKSCGKRHKGECKEGKKERKDEE